MTKMTEAQRKAILDQHHQPGRPLGHRVMLSTWSAMVRQGWAVGSRLDGYYTPAGLRAAGVDLDALHAEALTEDFLRRPAMVRAMEIGVAERGRATAKAVDNRAEIGTARTQRFHELFKMTRDWGVALDLLHAEALKLNAPVPAFNETVHFKHGGRVISGTVSATITGMPEGDKVIVYSPTLGHTNRIDHGVTVSVVDLLSDAPVEPERWSLDALPVVIEAHVERMSECTDRMEVPRAEWDAMTPAQRRDLIDTFGTETMNGQGGYGASIVSGAPDSDLDDPPNTPAEARTGVSDRVAAALKDVHLLRGRLLALGAQQVTHETLDRIEQLLRAEAGR